MKFLGNRNCRHEFNVQKHNPIITIQVESLVADLWDAWRNALRQKLVNIPEELDKAGLQSIVAIADKVR